MSDEKNYSVSRQFRLYDNDTGNYVAVKDDDDGLDLCELIQHDDGKQVARICVTREEASQFAAMILEWCGAPR